LPDIAAPSHAKTDRIIIPHPQLENNMKYSDFNRNLSYRKLVQPNILPALLPDIPYRNHRSTTPLTVINSQEQFSGLYMPAVTVKHTSVVIT